MPEQHPYLTDENTAREQRVAGLLGDAQITHTHEEATVPETTHNPFTEDGRDPEPTFGTFDVREPLAVIQDATGAILAAAAVLNGRETTDETVREFLREQLPHEAVALLPARVIELIEEEAMPSLTDESVYEYLSEQVAYRAVDAIPEGVQEHIIEQGIGNMDATDIIDAHDAESLADALRDRGDIPDPSEAASELRDLAGDLEDTLSGAFENAAEQVGEAIERLRNIANDLD